jgi:hypothetical protein
MCFAPEAQIDALRNHRLLFRAARAEIAGLTFLQHIERVPAPVNAVAPNQSVPNFHDLHKLHLIAIRSRARIFPGDHAAIGEESRSEAIDFKPVREPHVRLCNDWIEHVPHLADPFANAILARLVETRCVAPLRVPRALRLTQKGRAFFVRLGAEVPF